VFILTSGLGGVGELRSKRSIDYTFV